MYMKGAYDSHVVQRYRGIPTDSSQSQVLSVVIEVDVSAIIQLGFNLFWADLSIFECLFLTGLKLGYTGTLVPYILHIFPPFFWIFFVDNLFSDLLVENQLPSITLSFSMHKIDSAVFFAIVTVSLGAVGTL